MSEATQSVISEVGPSDFSPSFPPTTQPPGGDRLGSQGPLSKSALGLVGPLSPSSDVIITALTSQHFLNVRLLSDHKPQILLQRKWLYPTSFKPLRLLAPFTLPSLRSLPMTHPQPFSQGPPHCLIPVTLIPPQLLFSALGLMTFGVGVYLSSLLLSCVSSQSYLLSGWVQE